MHYSRASETVWAVHSAEGHLMLQSTLHEGTCRLASGVETFNSAGAVGREAGGSRHGSMGSILPVGWPGGLAPGRQVSRRHRMLPFMPSVNQLHDPGHICYLTLRACRNVKLWLLQSLTELTGCLALQNMAGLSATNKSLLVLGNQASSQQVPWLLFWSLLRH